jgi:hypothetical protein
MANAVYPLYKEALLAASTNVSLNVDTATDGPFCALVDTGTYTYNASHQFFSSVSGVAGTDQRITVPTVVTGTLDGSDLTYTAVAAGNNLEALVIYRKNSGANTTWRLVLFQDASVTGLPVTPNGGNITVTWNASGIFTISSIQAKDDIVRLGSFGPVGVYEFCYRKDRTRRRHRGFMAHEVKEFVPKAVRAFDGLDHVCYPAAIAGLLRHDRSARSAA